MHACMQVSEDQSQSQQNGSKSEQNGGKHNGNKQWTCPVKGCKHVFSGKAVAMHKEKIKKAKANKGRRVAQLLCDFHVPRSARGAFSPGPL